jgi:superoxide dismutase, Cu-Zn family
MKEFTMKKADSKLTFLGLALLGAPLAVGCAGTEVDAQRMIATSGGAALVVYTDAYVGTPMAGMPHPISGTATATATGWDAGGKLRVKLTVAGLAPNRDFGSHLHKAECSSMDKAGGHYQHEPAPPMMATNPTYANVTNEMWLDFRTDANGAATQDLTVNWLPRPGEAKAIIIHDMKSQTAPAGGVAGPKLGCLPFTFTN